MHGADDNPLYAMAEDAEIALERFGTERATPKGPREERIDVRQLQVRGDLGRDAFQPMSHVTHVSVCWKLTRFSLLEAHVCSLAV